ncbi:MAG: hypothetical protein ACTIBA_05910, partial [Lactobacillus delbrueckii]
NLVDRLGANASRSFLFASKKIKKKKAIHGPGTQKNKIFLLSKNPYEYWFYKDFAHYTLRE